MAGLDWDGLEVSSRLRAWWDDDMERWVISGRHERDAGAGTAQDVVRLARLVLENVTDTNGPPLGLNEECEALPPAASAVLAQAVDLALHRTGGLADEEAVRLGGGMIAAGLHLIRESRPPGGPIPRPVHLPFSLQLDGGDPEDGRE